MKIVAIIYGIILAIAATMWIYFNFIKKEGSH